ncbi:MAG TPA: SRPBCC family protein [Anaerolineales bacterium]|nr:SRPBCC family protein [Anaerolineales bacterium]
MKHFTHMTQIDAPIEAVAAFHTDSRALKLLTPPPVQVQFNQVQPLREGSVADFTLWFGPLPVRWVAVHAQVDPLLGFTDIQARGPFASWVHRHSFSALDDNTTLITDEIQASPKGHPFWWAFGQLMCLSLPFLFAYRGRVVRRALRRQGKLNNNPINSFAGENPSS